MRGRKGSKKIEKTIAIQTNHKQRKTHTKNQNKQNTNTNNITYKKKLAVTWRRTGQDRLSICRAIN